MSATHTQAYMVHYVKKLINTSIAMAITDENQLHISFKDRQSLILEYFGMFSFEIHLKANTDCKTAESTIQPPYLVWHTCLDHRFQVEIITRSNQTI